MEQIFEHQPIDNQTAVEAGLRIAHRHPAGSAVALQALLRLPIGVPNGLREDPSLRDPNPLRAVHLQNLLYPHHQYLPFLPDPDPHPLTGPTDLLAPERHKPKQSRKDHECCWRPIEIKAAETALVQAGYCNCDARETQRIDGE